MWIGRCAPEEATLSLLYFPWALVWVPIHKTSHCHLVLSTPLLIRAFWQRVCHFKGHLKPSTEEFEWTFKPLIASLHRCRLNAIEAGVAVGEWRRKQHTSVVPSFHFVFVLNKVTRYAVLKHKTKGISCCLNGYIIQNEQTSTFTCYTFLC